MRAFTQTLLVLVLSMMCAFAVAAGTDTTAKADITLPESLAAQPGQPPKMTLVDFYSPFCGTCQAMEPYLDAIKAESGERIAFKRVDLADEQNAEIADTFGVDGTPAYFLFDENGKLVYRMENIIIPKLLRPKVLDAAGILPTQQFPDDLRGLLPEDDGETDFTLVEFHGKNCETCNDTDKYLNAMAFAEDDRLKIVHFDTDNKSVQKFMKDITLEETPSYVLYDHNSRELIRLEGSIEPQDFWQYYTMFAHNETP